MMSGAAATATSERIWSKFERNSSLRLLALVAVFTLPTWVYLHDFYMNDPDFGWHLRAGEWILSHHAVPQTDPFSMYGAGKPWYDYSWLFDIFFALLYRAFGLSGFAVLEIAFRIAIPVCVFRFLRSLDLAFWRAVAVTLLAGYTIMPIYAPRPGMFSVVFMLLELQIVLRAQLKNRTSSMYWLIPLFWFWASIHIEFIHGLFLLGVFAGEPILNRVFGYKAGPLQLSANAVGAAAASFLATFLTPYGWHLYSTVIVYAGQRHIYQAISEMLAMNFRQPYHYVTVLLAFLAVATVSWARNLRPLYVVWFVYAAALGFRSVKDVWFLTVVCSALIAASLREPSEDSAANLEPRLKLGVALGVLAVAAVGWQRYGISNEWIEMGLAGRYPEAAVRYVQKHHLQGPLYNDFSSGGFLIWRLPEIPVSMDGRTNVHGDERVWQYTNSLRGFPGWEKDPDLAQANLIIWPVKSPLVALLRCDPRFEQVFSDPQSVVFVRKPQR